MCGRYTNTHSPDQIVAALGLAGAPDPETLGRFNVAPTQEVLTAVARDGALQPRTMRWGLIPRWSDGPAGDDGGGRLRGCAIVVGPATAPVEAIHDRQPVILETPERRAAWLDPSVTEAD